ncbi:hypothetical protein MIND_01269800 [Mycena indigotica]|uniref:Uncharacterized protein n=1 Tax=Mycena indigotica TaxID=2126181 RepID=A0A8H6S0V8_9AGAR|nr:uncharacterized protein MIND_01269800 [Mycena indigotica]KAF7291260.1 hypothetical protein MIND_01269800 [Mycena indigotica]
MDQPPSVTNAHANALAAAQIAYFPPPPPPFPGLGLPPAPAHWSLPAAAAGHGALPAADTQLADVVRQFLAVQTALLEKLIPQPAVAPLPSANATELLNQVRGAQPTRRAYFPPPPAGLGVAPASATAPFQSPSTNTAPAPAAAAGSGPVLTDAIDLLHQIRAAQDRRAGAHAAELTAVRRLVLQLRARLTAVEKERDTERAARADLMRALQAAAGNGLNGCDNDSESACSDDAVKVDLAEEAGTGSKL